MWLLHCKRLSYSRTGKNALLVFLMIDRVESMLRSVIQRLIMHYLVSSPQNPVVASANATRHLGGGHTPLR